MNDAEMKKYERCVTRREREIIDFYDMPVKFLLPMRKKSFRGIFFSLVNIWS